uniref:RPAP1_C domain-containing protein n=1 Tax=Parastrongyloides trichosuri TaxID=131310 RepID=A0A0N5A485_PARTI
MEAVAKEKKTSKVRKIQELGPAPLPPRGSKDLFQEKESIKICKFSYITFFYYIYITAQEDTARKDQTKVQESRAETINIVPSAPTIAEENDEEVVSDKTEGRYQPKYSIGFVPNIMHEKNIYPELPKDSNTGIIIHESKVVENAGIYLPKVHTGTKLEDGTVEGNVFHEMQYLDVAYKDLEALRLRYNLKGIEYIALLDNQINVIMDNDLFPDSIYIQKLLEKFREFSKSRINATVDHQMNIVNLSKHEKAVWSQEILKINCQGVCGHGSTCSGIVTTSSFQYHDDSLKTYITTSRNSLDHEFEKFYPLEICVNSLIIQIEWCLQRVMHAFEVEIRREPCRTKISLVADDNGMGNMRKELRKILACLFLQLRKPVVSDEFAMNIKKWIKTTILILSKSIHVSDQIAIIVNLLRLPKNLHQEIVELIIPYLSDASFNDSLSYFGLLLSVIMKPVNNKDKFLSELVAVPEDDDDFLIVNDDSFEDNPIQLSSLLLISIIDRFNIHDLIGMHKKLYLTKYADPSFHLNIFTSFSHLVHILCEGLDNYSGKHEFKDFMIRIAHMQKEIIIWLYSLYSASQRDGNEKYCNLIKADLSRLMVYFFYKISNTDCPIIGQVLVGLPIDGMFIVDIYRLNYILTKDMKNVSIDILYDPSFNILIQNRKQKRWNNLFMEMNREITVEDACFFNSLAEVVGHLDFLDFSFLEQILESCMIDTTKREMFSKTGSEMISSMLMYKPECFKRLLDFIGRRHADLNSYTLDIFRCSNLSGVIPSIDIVNQLGKWLFLFDISHPVARVSISILKSINWKNCYQNEEYELYETVGKLLSQLQQTKCSDINKKIAKGGLNISKQKGTNVILEFNKFLWDICLRLPQIHVKFPYNDKNEMVTSPIGKFLHIMGNCMDSFDSFKTYGYYYLDELSKHGCHQAVALVIGRILYEFNYQVLDYLSTKEFISIFESMLNSNDSYTAFTMIGLGTKFPTTIVQFFKSVILLYLHFHISKNSTADDIYKYVFSVLKLMSLRTQVDFCNSMEFTYIFDCFVRYYFVITLDGFKFGNGFDSELFNLYIEYAKDSKKKLEGSMFGFMKSYEMPMFYAKTEDCDMTEFVLLSIYTKCSHEWQDMFFEYITKGKSPEAAINKVKTKFKVDITINHLSIIQWFQMATEKDYGCVIYPWIIQTLLYECFNNQKIFLVLKKNVALGEMYKKLLETNLPDAIKNTSDRLLKCQYELYFQSFREAKFIVKAQFSGLEIISMWDKGINSDSKMVNIDINEYITESTTIIDSFLKRFELDCSSRRENTLEPKWKQFKGNWNGLFEKYKDFNLASLNPDFSFLKFTRALPIYNFVEQNYFDNSTVRNNKMFNESFMKFKNLVHNYFTNKQNFEALDKKYEALIQKRMKYNDRTITGALFCKKQPFSKCDRPVNVQVQCKVYEEDSSIYTEMHQLRSKRSSDTVGMKSKLFDVLTMSHAQLNDFVLYLYQVMSSLRLIPGNEVTCDNIRSIGQNVFERIMCDTLADEVIFMPFNNFVTSAIKLSADIVCTDDRGKQRFQEQLLFFIFGGSGLLNHILHKVFQPGMFDKQSIGTTYETICEKLNEFGKVYDARQCLSQFDEILLKEPEGTLYSLIPIITKFVTKFANATEGSEECFLINMFFDHMGVIIRRTLPGSISIIVENLLNISDQVIIPDKLAVPFYEKLNVAQVLSTRDIASVDLTIINEHVGMNNLKFIKDLFEMKRAYHKTKLFSLLGKNICFISEIMRFFFITMGYHFLRNPLYASSIGDKLLRLIHELWNPLLFPVSGSEPIIPWEMSDQEYANYLVNVYDKMLNDVKYFSYFHGSEGRDVDVTKSIVNVVFPKLYQYNLNANQMYVTGTLRLTFRQQPWEYFKPSLEDFCIFYKMTLSEDFEVNGIVGDISVKINWTNICTEIPFMIKTFNLFYNLSIQPKAIGVISNSFKRSIECLTNLPNWHLLKSQNYLKICNNMMSDFLISRFIAQSDKSEVILYPELLFILKKISQIEVTIDLENKNDDEFEDRTKKIAIYTKIMNKLIFYHKPSEAYNTEEHYYLLFEEIINWLRKAYAYKEAPFYYGEILTNLFDLSSAFDGNILKQVSNKVKDYIKTAKTMPIIPGFQEITIANAPPISLKYEFEIINLLFKQTYIKPNETKLPECGISFIIDDNILTQLLQNFGSYSEYANTEWVLATVLDSLLDRQINCGKKIQFINILEKYCSSCLESNLLISEEFCIVILYYLRHLVTLYPLLETSAKRLLYLKSAVRVLEQFENNFTSNYIISSVSNIFKKLVSSNSESEFNISIFIKGVILFIKNQKMKNDVRMKSDDKIYKSRVNDFQSLMKANPISNKGKVLDYQPLKKFFTETYTILDAPIFYTAFFNKISEIIPPNFMK